MNDVTQVFLEHGVLGAVVVLLTIAVVYLNKQLQKTQNDRLEDAKKVTTTLLDVNERWHAVIDDLSEAVERLHERKLP